MKTTISQHKGMQGSAEENGKFAVDLSGETFRLYTEIMVLHHGVALFTVVYTI